MHTRYGKDKIFVPNTKYDVHFNGVYELTQNK